MPRHWSLWVIWRKGARAVALLAARVGTTRLIDNALLTELSHVRDVRL